MLSLSAFTLLIISSFAKAGKYRQINRRAKNHFQPGILFSNYFPTFLNNFPITKLTFLFFKNFAQVLSPLSLPTTHSTSAQTLPGIHHSSSKALLPQSPLLRTRQGYHPLFPVKRKLPWRSPHQHLPHHHIPPATDVSIFPSLSSFASLLSSSLSSFSSSSGSTGISSPILSSTSIQVYFYISLVLLSLAYPTCHGNPDAKRLYDDLLSNYNRLIRPVSNNTHTVLVRLGLRLSQLIDLVSESLQTFLCNIPLS